MIEPTAYIQCPAVPYVEISERRKSEAVWKEYAARNPRTSHNKMKMLFTMDVEGFCGEPRYIRHAHCLTDNLDRDAAFQQLILGGMHSERRVVEELSALKEIPLTFFVEPFSLAYTSTEAIFEVFNICDSGDNEAALHCHPFALRKKLLEELGLSWNGYMESGGLSRILRYGIAMYRQALNGRSPTSYRGGSLILYTGHFKALRNCGFRVDATGFLDNPNDYSGFGDRINNEPVTVEQGIYEIPLTTFYNLGHKGAKQKLDFNAVSYPEKLECITRNYSAGTKAVTMLLHSWCFSDYSVIEGRYGRLLNKYHGAVSQTALDELRFLADYIMGVGDTELTTCQGLYRDEVQPYAVDVSGEAIEYPVYPLPPSYGGLRKESLDGFLDLKKAEAASSSPDWPAVFWERKTLMLMLPNVKQPKAGDWSQVTFSLETEKGSSYCLAAELDCPYYNEKYRGRNTILYELLIDGQPCFSNYVTEPDRSEIIRRTFTAAGKQSEICIRVRCLKDEKPWNWGKAARLYVKHIHFRRSV